MYNCYAVNVTKSAFVTQSGYFNPSFKSYYCCFEPFLQGKEITPHKNFNQCQTCKIVLHKILNLKNRIKVSHNNVDVVIRVSVLKSYFNHCFVG